MALLTKTPTYDGHRTVPPRERSVATVTDLHRSFGSTHVLRGLDLEIVHGEFVALLGRSGSGKSTLLRSLAGLDPSRQPELAVTGTVSVAFQEPRLLPWRTVEDNVALALANGPRRRERRTHARRALDEVGLPEKRGAWPLALSGGQAQRVSLARALVREPDLLLLDEPFSALDALTRERFNLELLDLWEKTSTTIVIVTHSIPEAILLADRVVVMTPGPGRVAGIVPIDAPRPRSLALLDDAIVSRAAREIRAHLEQAVDAA
jgi:sulfonate transport system ATP-binding protein